MANVTISLPDEKATRLRELAGRRAGGNVSAYVRKLLADADALERLIDEAPTDAELAELYAQLEGAPTPARAPDAPGSQRGRRRRRRRP